MNGNTKLHGICNAAFYSTRPEGTETYYASRGERDEALDRLRARAAAAGLSPSAARAGIYAIESRVADVRREIGLHVRVVEDLADAI